MDIVLQGRQGKTLTVAGDQIRIEKQGLLTGRREKTIAIRNISSVEVKKPGAFVGFIQFSIAGGMPRDSSFTLSGGAIDAVKDENSVVFNGTEEYETALKVKSYVESWSAVPQTAQAPVVVSVADEIRKLKSLLDEGLLTADEFAQKKQQLLGL
jgi:Short C-terminal domain